MEKINLNENEVIDKYNETGSLRKTGIFFKVSASTISNILIKNNIIKNSSRKYYCNEHYFENIDTEEKAYWLGFLYADGCVRVRYHRNSYHYSLQFKIIDIEMLEWFNKSLDSNYPIKHSKGTNCYLINISSKILVNDLIKQGCVPRKSLILTFPNEQQVKPELYRHFIRGYFDGDGCVSLTTEKYRKIVNMAGTLSVIGFIKTILDKIGTVNVSMRPYINKNTIYYLECQNYDGILKIKKYFYNESNIFLKRKKDIFDLIEQNFKNFKIQFCQICNTKIESHFNTKFCKNCKGTVAK